MTNAFSRRRLLSGLAGAALNPTWLSPAWAQDIPTSCDVLVVGSGMAGLSAAISAQQEGVERIVLLEKGGLLGGHTLYSSGSIAAVSPKRQKRQGITDSVELFVSDAMKAGDGKGDPAMLATIAAGSEKGLDWLESLGVVFGPVFIAMSGFSPRCVAMPGNSAGRSYVMVLAETALRQGVHIVTSCPLLGLERANGAWLARVGSASPSFITARSIVLATGGFTANIAWRCRIQKELTADVRTSANPYGTAWDGAMGDGIAIARNVGGNLRTGYGLQLLPFWGGRLLDYVGGDIYLNQQGQRFVDESLPWNQIASAVLQLPEKNFWVVTDSQSHKGATLGLKLINGIVHKSSTVQDMARGMQISPEVLQQTLSRYNRFAETGRDKDFGKSIFMQRIDEPPFYWGQEHIFVHTTLDGIHTNTEAEVIDDQGEAIAGLYAAGETVGGIFGTDRLGGAGLTNALVMGRIAGANAAKSL